jgi:hypothetical protein
MSFEFQPVSSGSAKSDLPPCQILFTKAKDRNRVVFVKKIPPRRTVEYQCPCAFFVSILSLVALLSGCASRQDVRPTPAEEAAVVVPAVASPAVVLDGLRREHDVAFSSQAQRAIAAARRYLEQQNHQSVDAYYRVTQISDHYEVYVEFVSGYRGSEPYFTPGMFCTVLVREDGSVIRILPGA